MNSRATITHAKVSGSEYGTESILTLTLDVRLPTPVEVKSVNEWAASELDFQSRQQISQAQVRRREAKHPKKLTKAQQKEQAEAHEQGVTCEVARCATCREDEEVKTFICLAHGVPLLDCGECDEESAVFLDPEDVEVLRERHDRYVAERTAANQEALAAAHEAALFLLLIKKPVLLSIAPAQQAFAEMLQLAAPRPAQEVR
ncbi:MAG: hypothetical protein WEC75_09610 [Dehalococcoidia bacterium]